MSKNPLINALSAALYIGLISAGVYFSSGFEAKEFSVLMPMFMLSLLSLSVAVMACVFFYQPVQMYLDGHKAAAGKLLLQTIGCFAGITAVVALALLLSAFL